MFVLMVCTFLCLHIIQPITGGRSQNTVIAAAKAGYCVNRGTVVALRARFSSARLEPPLIIGAEIILGGFMVGNPVHSQILALEYAPLCNHISAFAIRSPFNIDSPEGRFQRLNGREIGFLFNPFSFLWRMYDLTIFKLQTAFYLDPFASSTSSINFKEETTFGERIF